MVWDETVRRWRNVVVLRHQVGLHEIDQNSKSMPAATD